MFVFLEYQKDTNFMDILCILWSLSLEFFFFFLGTDFVFPGCKNNKVGKMKSMRH